MPECIKCGKPIEDGVLCPECEAAGTQSFDEATELITPENDFSSFDEATELITPENDIPQPDLGVQPQVSDPQPDNSAQQGFGSQQNFGGQQPDFNAQQPAAAYAYPQQGAAAAPKKRSNAGIIALLCLLLGCAGFTVYIVLTFGGML